MNSKATKSPSLIQVLIDKYIYYAVINKNHKKSIIECTGYRQDSGQNLKIA